MNRGRFFVLMLLSVLLSSNIWAADEAAIQELQTDVSDTKTKADKNAADIESMKGGLPVLEERVSTIEDKLNSGDLNGEKGDKGDPGEPGPAGPQGPQGEPGPTGECSCDITREEFNSLMDRVAALEGLCEPSPEICDGIDNDCNDEIDDGLVAPDALEQDGVCSGSKMECFGSSGWIEPEYSSISGYESIESTCNDYLDNDCDGLTDEDDPDCFAQAPGSGDLVINEIDYDQELTDTMEFIEIYNVSPNAINLEGLSVILINGANTYIYNTIDLSGLVAVAPGEFLVIKSPNLEIISPGVLTVDFPDQENNIQNGPSDAVQLVLDLGGPGEISIDSVSYDGDLSPYTEASSAPGDIGSGSIGRIGGQDTNDNSVDFTYFDTPSPGLPNQ